MISRNCWCKLGYVALGLRVVDLQSYPGRKNKSGHPWIDAELKKQIRRQQRLYKKMKKTGDPDIKKAYRKQHIGEIFEKVHHI
jgi:hypothetical protein